MTMVDQICSPPELPQYLKNIHDLKPIQGIPSDEEMIEIHDVIRMAQKVVEAPGVGDPVLLYQLTEHLFNAQMFRYRSNYLTAVFPEDNTYTPPTLPAHISVSLEPIAGTPSDGEIMKVQEALRSYQQFSSVVSMFDPRVNMELSQHLFDLQIAKYTQNVRQNQIKSTSGEAPDSSSTKVVEQTAGSTPDLKATTNNPGSGANSSVSDQSARLVPKVDVQNALEQSNRLAEQANQLIERSNQIAERSNQIAERSNQLAERSDQSFEHSNKLAERFNELFERLNQHSEQSNQHHERANHLVEKLPKSVEKLGDALKVINKVLVRIQHAIVRSHRGNTIDALGCLVNEEGKTALFSKLKRQNILDRTSQSGNRANCRLQVVIEGGWEECFIPDNWLGELVRFFGIGKGICENESSGKLKAGKSDEARNKLCDYLSSALG
ncbi:laminin domain protein, putative [Rhizoctonia solani AG-3 Rhs1AP]|uniref:Laminin domain protein, putative n=1 Tax=Rhizoctonia solani AG-3 Rhs1AP TaxID=1086054 RepID=X8IZL8_9AGAM|nr:laminin domain protein, putative [Rhizoctonia solani AG-3 Rhs1AP]